MNQLESLQETANTANPNEALPALKDALVQLKREMFIESKETEGVYICCFNQLKYDHTILSIMNVLLDYGSLMTHSDRDIYFGCFFTSPVPVMYSFIALTSALSRPKVNIIQRDFITSQLSLHVQKDRLNELLNELTAIDHANNEDNNEDNNNIKLIITLLISLSDRMSNIYQLNQVPSVFNRDIYIPKLINTSIECIHSIIKKENNNNNSIYIIPQLLSRLCLSGYQEHIALCLTIYVMECKEISILKKCFPQILCMMSLLSLESIIRPTVGMLITNTINTDKSDLLNDLFRSFITTNNNNNNNNNYNYNDMSIELTNTSLYSDQIQYINSYMTEKWIYPDYSVSAHVASGIINIIYKVKPSLLCILLVKSSELWSQSYFLQNSTTYHQEYVTDNVLEIIHNIIQLNNNNIRKSETMMDDSLIHLMNGVQIRLSSSSSEIRNHGMDVAESFSKIVSPDEPLNFNENGRHIRTPRWERVANVNNNNEMNILSDVKKEIENKNKNESNHDMTTTIDPNGIWYGDDLTFDMNDNSDDDNDSDELEALDMDDDQTDLREVSYPTNISSLIDYFRKKEAYNEWETGLEVCERLIMNHPAQLEELAEPLCIELMNLATRNAPSDDNNDDNNDGRKYENLRLDSLVALLITCPQIIIPIIINKFYSDQSTVSQRMNALHIIAEGAKRLSGEGNKMNNNMNNNNMNNNNIKLTTTTTTSSSSSKTMQNDYSNIPNYDLSIEESKQIVANRIEQNTRRWGSAVLPETKIQTNMINATSEGHINRFGPIAPIFFFPLIQKLDRSPKIFNMFGSESIVLSQLITTCGVIVQCCGFNIAISSICKVLLEILFFVREHEHATVRRSSMFALLCILVTLPPSSLIRDFYVQIQEITQWLMLSQRSEVDVETKNLARVCLVHLQKLLKDHESIYIQQGMQRSIQKGGISGGNSSASGLFNIGQSSSNSLRILKE